MQANRILITLCILHSAFCISLNAQAPAWQPESIESHPAARWWWMGSAVDEENLQYLINEYAKAGIRTLEITPIYGVQSKYMAGKPANINYLTSNWMNMLKKTESIGAEKGVQIDMNMGTGWPFGGPTVTKDEAAGKLEYKTAGENGYVTTTDENPTIVFDVTAPNNSTLNCVMAYPQRMTGVDTLDVTEFVSGNTLTWTPENRGRWRVLAIYNGHTMQTVKRAAPGGEGLVLDHLDKDAVANYIKLFEDKFEQYNTPYPTTFFNDSYEIFGADWSRHFFEEFEARRGYKLQYHMQELLGLTSDKNTQVRSDYRETMADMYLDNFIKPWNEYAHRHGAITRNQSHGSPSNLLDTYASVDIPEIEGYGRTLSLLDIKGMRRDEGFYAANSSDFATLKLASSAAHVTGKRLASSETFTWFTEHFRTSFSQMKPEMDLMFLAGVNRMFFHGTTYSPQQVEWPGYKFYASIDMSPTNSIWKDAPLFMDYVTRCQSFLQWGEIDNDILIYFPCYNSWHTAGTNWLRLCPIDEFPNQYKALDRTADSLDVYGYGSDYISDNMIMKLTFEDGLLVTEGGAKYKAMQIPVTANMPAETKAKIETLKEQGAQIVETKRDESIFNTICAPEPMRRQLGLRYIRRSNPTGYHYFISNLTPNDIEGFTGLTVGFVSAAIFNPVDGSIRQALVNDNNEVYINLHSGESLILQTYNYDIASAGLPVDVEESKYETKDIPLDGAWTLSFDKALLADASEYSNSYVLDGLKTWEKIDDNTKQLMGTGSYATTVNLTEEQLKAADKIEIILGDVRESASVYINNEYVGTAWSLPFKLDCTKVLRAGSNTIRIDVTNLPANRIRQMDENGTVWRIFDDINISVISSAEGTTKDSFASWKLVPSGLNSPVSLRTFTNTATDISGSVPQSEASATPTIWYNMQGIRVPKPTERGFYINSAKQKIIIR